MGEAIGVDIVEAMVEAVIEAIFGSPMVRPLCSGWTKIDLYGKENSME